MRRIDLPLDISGQQERYHPDEIDSGVFFLYGESLSKRLQGVDSVHILVHILRLFFFGAEYAWRVWYRRERPPQVRYEVLLRWVKNPRVHHDTIEKEFFRLGSRIDPDMIDHVGKVIRQHREPVFNKLQEKCRVTS